MQAREWLSGADVRQCTGVTNPVTEPSTVEVNTPSSGSSKDSVMVKVHEVVVARARLPELPLTSGGSVNSSIRLPSLSVSVP